MQSDLKKRFFEPGIYKAVILLSAIMVWSGLLFGLVWPSVVNLTLIAAAITFNALAYRRRELAISYLKAAMARGILFASIPVLIQFALDHPQPIRWDWVAFTIGGFCLVFVTDTLVLRRSLETMVKLSEESGKTELATNSFFIGRPFPHVNRSPVKRIFPLVWMIPALVFLLTRQINADLQRSMAKAAFVLVGAGLAPLVSRPFVWILALRKHEKEHGTRVLTEYGHSGMPAASMAGDLNATAGNRRCGR